MSEQLNNQATGKTSNNLNAQKKNKNTIKNNFLNIYYNNMNGNGNQNQSEQQANNQKEINENKKIYFLQNKKYLLQEVRNKLYSHSKFINEQNKTIEELNKKIDVNKYQIYDNKKQINKISKERLNNNINQYYFNNMTNDIFNDIERRKDIIKETKKILLLKKRGLKTFEKFYNLIYKWLENDKNIFNTYEYLNEIILNNLECYFIPLSFEQEYNNIIKPLNKITQILEILEIDYIDYFDTFYN